MNKTVSEGFWVKGLTGLLMVKTKEDTELKHFFDKRTERQNCVSIINMGEIVIKHTLIG